MKESSEPQIQIDLMKVRDLQCLRFVFHGRFNKEVCSKATAIWSQRFNENPGQDFDLLWDCTLMSGFDADSRGEWVRTLSDHSDRIGTIYVVADSILIRGAAGAMGNFSKYNMKVFRTVKELKTSLQ